MNNKKVSLLLVVMLVMTFIAGCSGDKKSGEDGNSNKLVIYSTENEAIINAIMPVFEEETGIEVELVSAGSGELMKRIESEKENPYGDLMFGGNTVNYVNNKDLFEDYVSKNNDDLLDEFKNTKGYVTPHVSIGYCLLVNTDLVEGLELNGYEDLLKPEFKGKISMGDPASSSSSFGQLMNMLVAMGGDFESEEGWDYVAKFVENLDGKIASSSGAVHKSVADGEYIVGLNIEGQAIDYKKNGAPMDVVYPEEGSVFLPGNSGIIKGAKNMENAQEFIDFITSKKAQDIFTTELPYRAIRPDAAAGEDLLPLEDIKIIDSREDEANEKKSEIIERYMDILTEFE